MSRKRGKPARLRYLVLRGGIYYYQRRVNGRRIRISTKSPDPEVAIALRDAYEDAKGIGRRPYVPVRSPTFAEFTARFLAERATPERLSPKTADGYRRDLDAGGPILPYLGGYKLDEITEELLESWWEHARAGARGERSVKRRLNLLMTISSVLSYAERRRLVDVNPARRLRADLGDAIRREDAERASPIVDPADLDALVDAARAESEIAHLYVLLHLDAGLRSGEALGLTWRRVFWGESEDDPRRHLWIAGNRPRGGAEKLPKSGRARRVALSRRLRRALRARYVGLFGDAPIASEERDRPVIVNLAPDNFRARGWRRVREAAGLVGRERRRLHDLRHTFASQLLTAGVRTEWISAALGHHSTAFTERVYARWLPDPSGALLYHEPLRLEPGDVPPDLLARLRPRDRAAEVIPLGERRR